MWLSTFTSAIIRRPKLVQKELNEMLVFPLLASTSRRNNDLDSPYMMITAINASPPMVASGGTML